MKEVIFDKKEYKTYKEFYRDLVIKLGANEFIDFADTYDLNCSADRLNEFMWYCHYDNLAITMRNFDIEDIKKQKTHENYKWKLIIEIMEDFAKNYPNNTVEFVKDEEI